MSRNVRLKKEFSIESIVMFDVSLSYEITLTGDFCVGGEATKKRDRAEGYTTRSRWPSISDSIVFLFFTLIFS